MNERQLLHGLAAIALALACAPRPEPREPAPPPAEAHFTYDVELDHTPATTREQPAAVKLKLGHYKSASRGIGLTIDLTEETENAADIDPAKLRFDGEAQVWRLAGEYGSNGRIDYVAPNGHVVLQVWEDGRRAVFVPGTDSHEIFVVRDGDADPL